MTSAAREAKLGSAEDLETAEEPKLPRNCRRERARGTAAEPRPPPARRLPAGESSPLSFCRLPEAWSCVGVGEARAAPRGPAAAAACCSGPGGPGAPASRPTATICAVGPGSSLISPSKRLEPCTAKPNRKQTHEDMHVMVCNAADVPQLTRRVLCCPGNYAYALSTWHLCMKHSARACNEKGFNASSY